VRFNDGGDAIEAPVYDRSTMGAGAALTGPAVVEQLDSTILLPPDCEALVDETLNIRIEVGP
jgi:N-methylhydantoinase A